MENEIDAQKIDITLQDIQGEEKSFTTLKSLSSFINNEEKYWQDEFIEAANHPPVNHIRSTIKTAKQEITNLRNNLPSWDEGTRKKQLGNVLARAKQHAASIPFTQTPLAIAFASSYKIGPAQGQAFWIVATKQGTQLPNTTPQYLEGAILGYEFLHQDESIIYKRRDSEKRAFSSLRKTLSDQTDEIVSQIDDFRAEIDDWKNSSKQDLAEDREVYKNEQAEFLSSSNDKLETQLKQDSDDREVFFETAKKKLEELENLYREKLRLEPAADYWNKRAEGLRNAGRIYGAILAVVTGAIGLGFGWLFYQWMTKGKVIEKITAEHWQGVVILAATLTMFIYLIRVLGKMTFSSFHLQRDAEERELLSYLYLALSEKGTVDNETRQVVLQALFSRAETGLLTGDHGPTIPVAEVVQKLKSN